MANEVLFRVYRRRGPMVPALLFGLLQIAAGVDTLFIHAVLPASPSLFTTITSVLLILLGLVLVGFVAVQLFFSPPLLEARPTGLYLYVTEGDQPVHIPWDALKAVELGRPGKDPSRREDPLCLVLRFTGSRVARPSTLVGVFHSTKGSLYIRASHLPDAGRVVERLKALWEEYGGPAKEKED
ncbi:MAG: hypothetical protein ACP5TV_09025 [Anaerolineae bacterium]